MSDLTPPEAPESPAPAAPPPPPEPLPPAESLSPYHATVRRLSDRLVEAQRPIRILDACKWEDDVERAFFASGCRELPSVTRDYYDSRPPKFELATKRQEFYDLERDIRRELGTMNSCGQLMLRASKEYRSVLDLIEHRGTPAFSAISQGLYGSTFDRFHAGDPTLGDLGRSMAAILSRLLTDPEVQDAEKDHDSAAAVAFLSERMDAYFGPGVVTVKLSDGVVADAAAGADYIKVREDARFSRRDLEVLEVHEGWVHIGTTLNGQTQPVATFLGKGTPSCTVTQEGLAIVQEIFTFKSKPSRAKRLTDRIEAIRMAEEGADFLEVFRALLESGTSERDAYQTTQRAFRGSLPSGCGPFTKDVSYSKGFILIYNFIRLAVREGKASRIPLLFLGKLRLEDLGTLHELFEEGLLAAPRYLPPPYTDLRGLSAWMAYSNFLNSINLERAREDYASLITGGPATD